MFKNRKPGGGKKSGAKRRGGGGGSGMPPGMAGMPPEMAAAFAAGAFLCALSRYLNMNECLLCVFLFVYCICIYKYIRQWLGEVDSID